MGVRRLRKSSAPRVSESGSAQRKSMSDEPRLGMLIKRAEQAMVHAKSVALKSVGITPAQYLALVELDLQPGITAAALARACLVTPQAIMILLKTMEQQGLISRAPHPRHENVLELRMTDVGREELGAARNRVDPIELRVFSAFSAKDLATFRTLLSRFIDGFEAK